MSCRFALLSLFALVAAGCSSTSPAPVGEEEEQASGPTPIKVSYIRFNADPKGYFVPQYQLMLSEGWRLKYGRAAREPFLRIFPSPFTAESVPDRVMLQLLHEMERHGLNDLVPTRLQDLNLQQLQAVQKARTPEEAARWRIINIETEAMRRTVAFYDNDDQAAGGTRAKAFRRVEFEVMKVAQLYTIQVTVEKPPLQFK